MLKATPLFSGWLWLAHMKARWERLLELRLDAELTREEFQEKRSALDFDQARASHKLLQTESLIAGGG